MKLTEKVKTQKIVEKIQQNNFDENDIDGLFMRLRAYSKGKCVFREIADFVAHNDNRDRGLSKNSLETIYLRMKFFVEYNSPEPKPLDINYEFPLWIKKLILLQVDQFDEFELKDKFNVSRDRLKKRIVNGFKEDKITNTAVLKHGKISPETFDAIQHVLSYLIIQPVFTQDKLISELIDVIRINNINLDVELFQMQSDKITLCTMLLLHNARFDFNGHKPGLTKISCDSESVLFNTMFIDADGNAVDNNEGFGNLAINGYIIIDYNGTDITMTHPLMETKLDVSHWCHENMFTTQAASDKTPNQLCKKVSFSDNLYISNDFKLSNINAI
ncbi:TPA: hypothetical protein QHC12_002187 [Aeromonas hydrophila subsp. hydrophila]|nr:hypothetical protein [Aeromonas hydrophila subsp. hydrophila]